jgi:hypothetical protein
MVKTAAMAKKAKKHRYMVFMDYKTSKGYHNSVAMKIKHLSPVLAKKEAVWRLKFRFKPGYRLLSTTVKKIL